MKHDQFTLPFLDTTSLGGGLGLYSGFPTAKSPALPEMTFEPEEAEVVDAPDPTKPAVPAHDYRLAGDRRLAQGWKARARDNLAAIRLMTAIEAEGRHARPDEQELLAKFTAFGATDLADHLFRRAGEGFAPAWEDPRPRARSARLARGSRQSQECDAIRAFHAGVHDPRHLAGAAQDGVRRRARARARLWNGLFFAFAPEALAGKLALTGVEMDAITARIAKLLYPNARIRHQDFTKARLPDVFDLAIRNLPFSDRTVRADDAAGLTAAFPPRLFFRPIDRAAAAWRACGFRHLALDDGQDRPIGRASTPRSWRTSSAQCAWPKGAMHAAAGMEVVVDILFLQRRDAGAAPGGAAWETLSEAVPAEGADPALSINRYFLDHPEMVLGTHGRTSSAYGPIYTCQPVLSTTGALEDELTHVLDRLPRDLFRPSGAHSAKNPTTAALRVGTAAEGAAIKEGSYLVHEGALVQIIAGEPQAVAVRDGKGTEGSPRSTPASSAA